jgi:hypothetical protein
MAPTLILRRDDSDSSHWPVIAAALAFFDSMARGLALTILVIRLIPAKVPNPTEAYEGFGDAIMLENYLLIGTGLSLIVSMSVAAVVGSCVARRKRRVP